MDWMEKNLLYHLKEKQKKSGEKGITWNKQKQKWAVQIKGVYLGWFDDLDDAIKTKYDYLKGEIEIELL